VPATSLGTVSSAARFFGYWVGKPYRRQGIATEVSKGLLDFAFAKLGAQRVWAMAFADNLASRRVLEKVGLRQEALLRRNTILHGRWRDDACYGVPPRGVAARVLKFHPRLPRGRAIRGHGPDEAALSTVHPWPRPCPKSNSRFPSRNRTSARANSGSWPKTMNGKVLFRLGDEECGKADSEDVP